MYSKQESALLIQQFWTSLGQYMSPVPSSEGIKINWINYKTGIKDIQFKMEAGNNAATIAILITHTDTARQKLVFNLFKQLQSALHAALQEEWRWEETIPDENGKTISRIYTSVNGVSIYRKEDWPVMISFLKPRMIALDAFWNEVKFGFDV